MVIGEGSKTGGRASLSQLDHPLRVDLSSIHALSNEVIIRKGHSSFYTTKAVNLDYEHDIGGGSWLKQVEMHLLATVAIPPYVGARR